MQVLAGLQLFELFGRTFYFERVDRYAFNTRTDQSMHAGYKPPRLERRTLLVGHDLDRVSLAVHRHQTTDCGGFVRVQESDALAFIDKIGIDLE